MFVHHSPRVHGVGATEFDRPFQPSQASVLIVIALREDGEEVGGRWVAGLSALGPPSGGLVDALILVFGHAERVHGEHVSEFSSPLPAGDCFVPPTFALVEIAEEIETAVVVKGNALLQPILLTLRLLCLSGKCDAVPNGADVTGFRLGFDLLELILCHAPWDDDGALGGVAYSF